MTEDRWLSQEAHDRLRAELNDLRENGRPRISAIIEEARAHGDLRENAEYHAAKEEQGRMEARIRQLEALLRDTKIGEAPSQADTVVPGVIVRLDVDGDEETYFVSTTREERHGELDVISTSSPIGAAIVGATPGDTVKVQIPTGTIEVTVREIRL